jgi:hypothetical protein
MVAIMSYPENRQEAQMDDPEIDLPFRFKWDRVEERDCGYETPCWLRVMNSGYWRRFLEATVGVRGEGEVYMHLCEVPGVYRNACIRPEHIRIGTQLENMRHARELHRRASRPWISISPESNARRSATLKGRAFTDDHRAKTLAAMRTPEVRARMSAGQRRRQERERNA